MKFSDNIIRDTNDCVFVKRDENTFRNSDDSYDLNSDVVKHRISYNATAKAVNLYEIRANSVKVGENIYNEKGEFEAYRSE